MFKVNQIDKNHLQFSGNIEDTMFEKESFVDEIYEMQLKINSGETIFGQINNQCGDIQTCLDTSNASHKITKINIDEENNYIYGVLEILDTHKGKQIKEIMEHNFTYYLTVSPMCIEFLDEKNDKIYVDEISTFNINLL